MAATQPLRFDPIAEARRQWEAHGWKDAAPGMAAVTSVVRAYQIYLARVDRSLKPFGLTFARYELLMLLLFSRRGSLPLNKLGSRLQVHPTSITNAVDRPRPRGFWPTWPSERSPHDPRRDNRRGAGGGPGGDHRGQLRGLRDLRARPGASRRSGRGAAQPQALGGRLRGSTGLRVVAACSISPREPIWTGGRRGGQREEAGTTAKGPGRGGCGQVPRTVPRGRLSGTPRA